MSTSAATRDEIARLFGRAAFGATAPQLDMWAGRPYADAVDTLVNIPAMDGRSPQPDEARRIAVEKSGTGKYERYSGAIRLAQVWWLERMRTARYPLEERMTLFWHGHFATGVRESYPDVAMLMVQNQTMRRNALGNFSTLVTALTLDPAMMEWLDGARNSIPTPNENYAREFLELFTLGKFPQVYTEHDVREAARALTGWISDPSFQKVQFNPAGHDTGAKFVLGSKIVDERDREYLRLIDIALAQPVAARFIAAKLVANFAYTPDMTNLLTRPDPLVARVADALRANWDIRPAMRVLLLSDEFRTGDPAIGRQLVRQPVELVVASAKALGFSLDNDTVAQLLDGMGQTLFSPPNVAGFPVGVDWLSPSTAVSRYDWGVFALNTQPTGLPASSDVDGWTRRLGLGSLTAETATVIRQYAANNAKATEADRQAGVLVLLLASPDWAVV